MSRASYHCTKCGADMEQRYRPAGFDGFFGYQVYVREGRCPNRTGILGGLFSGHSFTADRDPERADWFGFADETIPTAWPAGEPKP